MPITGLDALLELSANNDGFLTTRLAEEAGISRRALAGMVKRGRLERVARGVYRLAHSIPSALSPYREVLHWAQSHNGPRVALSHETALTILGLTDANPSAVHLTAEKHARLRRSRPPHIVIHRAPLMDEDLMEHEGLPMTTVPRTILDLAQSGNFRLARDAIVDARREGYLAESHAQQLATEVDTYLHVTRTPR